MNPDPALWTLVWATVFQVLLFRFGIFWGYGLLAVHLYALFRMPVGWSPPPTSWWPPGPGRHGCGLLHRRHALGGCTTLGMAYRR